MIQRIGIVLTYLAETLVGFFAGAMFAMSLVLGVTMFVANVVMESPLGGTELERVLDFVGGPMALLFSVMGAALGIVRARRWVVGLGDVVPPAAVDSPPKQVELAAVNIGGFAVLALGALAVGIIVWPWIFIAMTGRGYHGPIILGAITIPLGVGVITVVGWRLLRTRRSSGQGQKGPRAAIRRTPPALYALAFASSALLAVGTLAEVSRWHEILAILLGLPLTLAVFFAHLLSCVWFFRPVPPRE